LNCTVCGEPLIILELNKTEIDYCTNCHGLWLDEGELELLLENSKEKENFLNSFTIDLTNPEQPVRCPICLRKMEKIICGDEKKITLDKCPRLHGLWFNKGELEAVVRTGNLEKGDKIAELLKEMFSFYLNQ